MRYEVMLRANAVFAIEVEADDEDRAASLAEAELANAMSKGIGESRHRQQVGILRVHERQEDWRVAMQKV